MTDPLYPAPPRPTLADLDPESLTTDRLIALVRSHRTGEEYLTAEVLLGNLPKVLHALCDHILAGQTTTLEVAYRIAPLIDAIEYRALEPARYGPLTNQGRATSNGGAYTP